VAVRSPPLNPFEWLIVALSAFRIQRIVTKDDLPPSIWLRDKVEARFGDSSWSVLVVCQWCFGFWTAAAVVAEHHYLNVVPMVVHYIFATSAVVGILGTYDERP
jgi:hypothetical protein